MGLGSEIPDPEIRKETYSGSRGQKGTRSPDPQHWFPGGVRQVGGERSGGQTRHRHGPLLGGRTRRQSAVKNLRRRPVVNACARRTVPDIAHPDHRLQDSKA